MEQKRISGSEMKRTKVKICGLRRPEDVRYINQYRPDYCGFICSEPFWRYVPENQLAVLSAAVDPGIRRVGVFVNDPPEKVADYVRKGLIDIVQLHGKEDDAYIAALRGKMREQGRTAKILKAFKITGEADIEKAAESSADCVLLDSGTGSGRTFDWRLIRDIGRDFFLAGGLGPEKIREAIRLFHPYAVDISSGAETDRKKDPEKIRKCIEAAAG